jgi:hypothetical protein
VKNDNIFLIFFLFHVSFTDSNNAWLQAGLPRGWSLSPGKVKILITLPFYLYLTLQLN